MDLEAGKCVQEHYCSSPFAVSSLNLIWKLAVAEYSDAISSELYNETLCRYA